VVGTIFQGETKLNKIQAYWNSLPHEVQAAIMLFAGAAVAILKHNFADAHGCLTSICLKGYLWAALHGGLAAVVALYIPSSLGKH
jgi:hypothetical protein